MSGSGGRDVPDFRPDGTGVRLRLRVSAGASRTRVAGVHGGALKAAVVAPPEKGRANREVVRLLAGVFGVAARDVEIVSGEASPDKVVRLPLSLADASARWGAGANAPDSIAPSGRSGARKT